MNLINFKEDLVLKFETNHVLKYIQFDNLTVFV